MLQNGIKATDKDRLRKKITVNCSKGYLDAQKEKTFEWDENYLLDTTVWETLPSPSVDEVFKSSPTAAGPGRKTALCLPALASVSAVAFGTPVYS